MSHRVNLVAPASPIECLLYLPKFPGDAVQTGTGKVDPARKFKCTTAARVPLFFIQSKNTIFYSYFPLFSRFSGGLNQCPPPSALEKGHVKAQFFKASSLKKNLDR